jgi:glycine/D-amino acid oxidase-like deaminating enzyme
MTTSETAVAIIGTGIVGIAAAYYLAKNHGQKNIVLIDQGQPMALTSAQSGDNYRNWWPHPLMAEFTNRSISLMEDIARESNNRIGMTRRGYILCTRQDDVQKLIDDIAPTLGDESRGQIRLHRNSAAVTYQTPDYADWQIAPSGFDILQNADLIRRSFPSLDQEIKSIIHIRRAGDISGQQLGQYMLEYLRENGCRRVVGSVTAITRGNGFAIALHGADSIRAERLVNAAGPFAGNIAKMLGIDLPVFNIMQQKISFPDDHGAIPRNLPFAIDLDRQQIDWTDDERGLLMQDQCTAHLVAEMPGAIHCRPDGGDGGSWVKLGWAYNETPAQANWDVPLDPQFPEIVLRGAARLNPGLKRYYERLPRQTHHYGGWYTRTADNWPLIGPMDSDGAFMACALSGHGTMGACATGELAASWIVGEAPTASYARNFSLERYLDTSLAPAADLGAGVL